MVSNKCYSARYTVLHYIILCEKVYTDVQVKLFLNTQRSFHTLYTPTITAQSNISMVDKELQM